MITQPPPTAPGPSADPSPSPAPLTPTLVGSAIIAALGGLLFGFDTVVISGTEGVLKGLFHLTSGGWGFTVAIGLVGTIIGSIFAGKPADAWGRKRVMLVLAVLYFLAAAGSALAWDWYSLLAFRFLGGLAVGGASVVSPLYIAEISPARFRGRLVATQQFNVVLGILVAFLSNYLIAQLGLGTAEWRWMLGIQMVPSAAFFFLLFFTPESPRWLVGRGRSDQARAVLARLGVETKGIDREVAEIQHSLDLAHQHRGDSIFQAKYRKPVLLAVAIAMFNQLSGINAVMYYAPTIFKMAGAGKDAAPAPGGGRGRDELAVHDDGDDGDRPHRPPQIDPHRVDRLHHQPGGDRLGVLHLRHGVHPDWLAGRAGRAAAVHRGARVRPGLGNLGLHQRDLPQPRAGGGAVLGSTTHWVMAALITWTFPAIAEKSGGSAFAFYAIMMFVQLLWAIFVMPETKGIPLEEMQKQLGIE